MTLSGGANATTSGVVTSQTGLTGAMTTVTYTANTGYYFAEFADISSNGITARRTSSTVVTVSGTPTADATITVPDAVEKTAATVTKAPTAKSLTYTGSVQELVTAGKAEGGTMNYAIGKDDKTAPTDGWSASIPAKTDAGTYYVWYKVVGDANHNDIAPQCIPVTISQTESEKQTEKHDTTPSGGGGGSIPQTTDPTPAPTTTPSETVEQPTTTGDPTITQDAFTGVSETIAPSTDGTAVVTSVAGTVGNTLRITGTVNQGGTNYPVSSFATESFRDVDVKNIFIDLKTSGNTQTVTFQPRTFKGSEAKKLTLRLSSSGQVKFSSGALSGSKIKKVVVSGLKKKEFKRVEKKLRKSGYKGKIVKK